MVLSEKWVSFIQSGVAVTAGSRDANNVPCLVRAMGCRVSADRTRITILAARSQSAPVLDAVRETGAIAVVFSQPSTHTTIQLKGVDASPGRVLAGDAALVMRKTDEFTVDACSIGYPEPAIRALFSCDTAELVAITFKPTSAFVQTPGPRAGEPLED